jgi:serine/threonine protein kinase
VKAGDTIGPYILERRLGKGVTASTWLARRAQTDSDSSPGTPLVLKIFDIAETDSWKPLDQFRREADILRTLSHPRIPKYIESFDAAHEGDFLFVLVMEYIQGETVEAYIASGKKFTEEQIENILAELADILVYIGTLRPPIVHRDINPRNLIIRPDGHIALVDFSGVQDAIRTALYPGATLVGTAGYIPVEQVSGRATHRSDLYGAAATAVFMLTGRNPAELPVRNLKIDLSGLLYMSPRLSYVLDNWLDPDPDRRFLSATKSASILRGESPASSASPASSPTSAPGMSNQKSATHRPESREYPSELPADSALEIQTLEPGLYIKLPRRRLGASRGFTVFPIVFLGFVFFWTTMTMRMRAPIFFPLFSIPFWIVGITMAKSFLSPSFTDTELFITPDGLLKKNASFISNSTQQFRISDVGKAQVRRSSMQMNNHYLKELAIEAGTGTLTFGAGLSDRELYFLERRINEEVVRLKQLLPPDTDG